ncbi:receptor expression-enhancing protein 6 isoform X2 [Elephas maximus indicus]|uniref:receptor expression-enhancing protein 6 isoform X2 n=1 Tax=Elephas maximus indicus TaxID=99487 RepID=UPI002116473A|nr:receptor expression-enhancing protein 6 isoform X2 [Elephas maximus indicus]
MPGLSSEASVGGPEPRTVSSQVVNCSKGRCDMIRLGVSFKSDFCSASTSTLLSRKLHPRPHLSNQLRPAPGRPIGALSRRAPPPAAGTAAAAAEARQRAMRRGRGGRPHLLCPPCPPIGRSGGGRRRWAKRGRSWRAGSAARRSSSGCQPRRRCHGRSATAVRAASGTEEPGHRGARGARSQDRCREAVFGHGSRDAVRPISSIRLRGISAVQSHRICIPRICFNQGYRESQQRGRHFVAHILGGLRPLRAGRVLQRSTPVLVPFLLRGKVRLPVILHDARALERGPHPVSSRRPSTVSKASRSGGQRRQRPQRASPGRGSRTHQGGPGKRDTAAEGQVKPAANSCENLQAGELDAPDRQPSTDSSTGSPPEVPTSPSGPGKTPGVSSHEASGNSRSQSPVATSSGGRVQPPMGSASSSQLPSKTGGRPHPRGNSTSRPQGPNQQRPRLSMTPTAPGQTSRKPSTPSQHPSGTISQIPAPVQTPSGTNIPVPVPSPSKTPSRTPSRAPSRTTSEPGDVAPKSSKCHWKRSTRHASNTSVAKCSPSETSLETSCEWISKFTYTWPYFKEHRLRCLRHCWQLEHLAC